MAKLTGMAQLRLGEIVEYEWTTRTGFIPFRVTDITQKYINDDLVRISATIKTDKSGHVAYVDQSYIDMGRLRYPMTPEERAADISTQLEELNAEVNRARTILGDISRRVARIQTTKR